ncbi:DUF5325 family protein [Gorillibacterium sp. sgz5001074]|uniref:DUF5325 family protein n=1 Tax=Gorillibacterium sp. sgz5001074 TaxID=3446695 RepID=UPI003F66643A
MGRNQALFFSFMGVALLLGISFSISLRNGWLVLLFSLAALLWIGFGFAMKARARRTLKK